MKDLSREQSLKSLKGRLEHVVLILFGGLMSLFKTLLIECSEEDG